MNDKSSLAGASLGTEVDLLIAALARRLEGARRVVVGANQPIPAAAGLLAEALAGGAMRVAILGSTSHFPFPEGGREIFDLAGQGRIDTFFLGGGQIDGHGNINLVGTGGYPEVDVRFPGSFGSAYLYFTVPKVILFRREHSRRVLVPKVDFISAPGTSPPGVYRPGGPSALVTEMAALAFDRAKGRFCLDSVHPGHDLGAVREATGFDFDTAGPAVSTPPPSSEEMRLLRGSVRETLARIYPSFVDAELPASA